MFSDRELHTLRLHHYRKRKKGGEACKRSKPPNSEADAAKSGGRNRDTETNAMITLNFIDRKAFTLISKISQIYSLILL